MARRLGRRKAPLREDFMLREQKKVDEGFDTRTMIYLSKFFNKGIISRLEFRTASGKESDIYIASAGAGLADDYKFVILKFFRIETSLFVNMSDYIIGDPRFSGITGSKAGIINVWCRKEFGNLLVAEKCGVRAPKPFMSNGNILAMEFIGDGSGTPAPPLYKAGVKRPEAMLDSILSDMKKLYAGELVHADISEYNILVHRGKPFFIDFGQAVSVKHPKAMEFLRRDTANILQYFDKRYGIRIGLDDALSLITG
jgi:RIO kinase 1